MSSLIPAPRCLETVHWAAHANRKVHFCFYFRRNVFHLFCNNKTGRLLIIFFFFLLLFHFKSGCYKQILVAPVYIHIYCTVPACLRTSFCSEFLIMFKVELQFCWRIKKKKSPAGQLCTLQEFLQILFQIFTWILFCRYWDRSFQYYSWSLMGWLVYMYLLISHY